MTTRSRAGRIGERLRDRRVALGLTQQETARRAGVDAHYLVYLEEQGGAPSGPVLSRLANVLASDARALASLARHPAGSARRMEPIDEDDCWTLLGGVSVGRIALALPTGPPLVHLVNFIAMDRRVVIRTDERSQLAYAAGALRAISFECDHVDEGARTAWSVLVTGAARAATADQAARLHVEDLVDPWPGGERRAVVTIHPDGVTGRRIVPDYHVPEPYDESCS